MKKILALVLVLALSLTAFSAFAAGSPENPDEKVVEEEAAEVAVPTAQDTEGTTEVKAALSAAQEAGDVLSILPEDVRAEIPEECTTINEMVTVKLPEVEADESGNRTFKKAFQTPFTAGEKVSVLFGIPKDDGTIEWVVLEGTANDAGEIVFTVDDATYTKLSAQEVVMCPVTK